MQTFASEETKSLVELHRCGVSDFSFKGYLVQVREVTLKPLKTETHLVSLAFDHDVDCHADKLRSDAFSSVLFSNS